MYCTRDQGFACEVITAGLGFSVHVTVWNSYGCGCDAKAFRAGSWTTRKRPNGPRIWTADTFVSGDVPTPGSLDEAGKYVTEEFDGITYRMPREVWHFGVLLKRFEWGRAHSVPRGTVEGKHGAELDIPIQSTKTGNRPFVRSNISRAGKRIWRKGRQVYELNVGGDTFVMQAISQQVDPTLTDNSGLKDLLSRKLPGMDTFGNKIEGGGSPMSLPAGTTYRCRVLAEDLILESHGTAVIMQDRFYNSYMLEDVKARYSDEECVEETEQWRFDYCGSALRRPRPNVRRG
ncbi:unnamed protein product [Prorocentrum cordatum]|uniref:Uncharacterized protein n=1 Tax=Prorocentrum cordatum TaxID=2364126 RepID=A0ABN9R273_9DINO|nr:unnamed protein product [Polarella glacialis]